MAICLCVVIKTNMVMWRNEGLKWYLADTKDDRTRILKLHGVKIL